MLFLWMGRVIFAKSSFFHLSYWILLYNSTFIFLFIQTDLQYGCTMMLPPPCLTMGVFVTKEHWFNLKIIPNWIWISYLYHFNLIVWCLFMTSQQSFTNEEGFSVYLTSECWRPAQTRVLVFLQRKPESHL